MREPTGATRHGYVRNYELRVRRVPLAKEPAGHSVREPRDVQRAARLLIGDCAQEVFLSFYLNVRNMIIGYSEIGRGGFSSVGVDPRVIFRAAIALGAEAIILAHNHPSGALEPSTEDDAMTHRLVHGAKLLGLELLDHVIVSDVGCLSYAAEGRL